jgi:hypothetical protein
LQKYPSGARGGDEPRTLKNNVPPAGRPLSLLEHRGEAARRGFLSRRVTCRRVTWRGCGLRLRLCSQRSGGGSRGRLRLDLFSNRDRSRGRSRLDLFSNRGGGGGGVRLDLFGGRSRSRGGCIGGSRRGRGGFTLWLLGFFDGLRACFFCREEGEQIARARFDKFIKQTQHSQGNRALWVLFCKTKGEATRDNFSPCVVFSGLFVVPCVDGFDLSVNLFSFYFERGFPIRGFLPCHGKRSLMIGDNRA